MGAIALKVSYDLRLLNSTKFLQSMKEHVSDVCPPGTQFDLAGRKLKAIYADVQMYPNTGIWRQGRAVGSRSINAVIYQKKIWWFFDVTISAYLAFDANGELQDIFVDRSVDAM